MSDAQMYLPDYVRLVAQSGKLNHRQHSNHVELLADFAARRDKEYYQLRNEHEQLIDLIADIKAWDVGQYVIIPHDLRVRMEAFCCSARSGMNEGTT